VGARQWMSQPFRRLFGQRMKEMDTLFSWFLVNLVNVAVFLSQII
jgi:hypothetical protein